MRKLLFAAMALVAIAGCGESESGVIGKLVVEGGRSGQTLNGEPASIEISVQAETVRALEVKSGDSIRVALPPGSYLITGAYGNAECISAFVRVTAGSWTGFEIDCRVR